MLLEILGRWAHRRLPQFARRRVDTGDLVQEALFRALRKIGELSSIEPSALKRYLMTCVNNLICDEIRRSRSGEVSNGLLDSATSASPLDDAIESENQRRYRIALAKLSEDDQVLLVGRLDLSLSYEELATATGRVSGAAA